MKRLSMDGSVLAIPRTKDKHYLYTFHPGGMNPKSVLIDHQMKIVDYYIEQNCPEKFLIEPVLGSYEPDIFYYDHMGRSICVEIQLTKISLKKMQKKVDAFINEYGKEHNSKLMILCSDSEYKKLKVKEGFKVTRRNLPKEIEY